ncbi:hypothetical protein FHG87_010094 [Trinorchestia longiramus]|nr:hypothetical protein FHG87_010094 [Trinorchestia longiramus]
MTGNSIIQVTGAVYLLLLIPCCSSSHTGAALFSSTASRSPSAGKRIDNSNPFSVTTNFPAVFRNGIAPPLTSNILVESSVKKLPPQKRCFYTSHTWMCPPQHLSILPEDFNEKVMQSFLGSRVQDLKSPSVSVKHGFRNQFQDFSTISHPGDFSGASNTEFLDKNMDLSKEACASKNCNESVDRTNKVKLTLPENPSLHPKTKPVSDASNLSHGLDIKLQKTIQSTVEKTPLVRTKQPKLSVQSVLNPVKLINGKNFSSYRTQPAQVHLSHVKQNPGLDKTDPKCSHSFHDYLCSENETNFENTANPSIRKSVFRNVNPVAEWRLKPMEELFTTTQVPLTYLVTNRIPEIDGFTSKSNTEPLNRSSTNSNLNLHTHNFVTSNPEVMISTSPTSSTEEPAILNSNTHYDRCLHPFHAWLCQKPIRNRLSSLAVPSKLRTTPTLKQVDNPMFSHSKTELLQDTSNKNITFDLSNSDPHKISHPEAFINTQTERNTLNPNSGMLDTPTSTSHLKNSLCKHSPHSWMCIHGQPQIRKTSSSRPLIPEVQDTKQASSYLPEKNNIASSFSDSGDPCLHSFHSWLCKLSRENQTGNEESHIPQVSLFMQNKVVSSINRPIDLNPWPSNIQVGGEKLKQDVDTGDRFGDESSVRDHRTFDAIDPCSHPFHSHLCTRVLTTNSPPIQNIMPVLESSPVPSHANAGENIEQMKPEARPYGNHKDKKCSHPFHSWLCAVAQKLGSDDKRSLSAIDSLIDSDRFLLKASNLPNIRQLPLDTGDSTAEISDFRESNPLNAAQLAYSTQHWENLNASREKLKTTTHSPRHIVTSLPSIPSLGSKIIPTLPSLITKEHSIPTPNPSHTELSLEDSGGPFTKTSSFGLHPQQAFNVHNPINFGNHELHFDPPRPTRHVHRGLRTKTERLRKLPKEVSYSDKEYTKTTQNFSVDTKGFVPSIVSTDAVLSHAFKDIKMESGFTPSSHFGIHRLHPSPFMQFPSITGKVNSHLNEKKPVLIIDSNFPDSVPSSTMSIDDSTWDGNFVRTNVPKEQIGNYRNEKMFESFHTKTSDNTRVISSNYSLRERAEQSNLDISQYSNPVTHHKGLIRNAVSAHDTGHVSNVSSKRETTLGTPRQFIPSARDGSGNPGHEVNFIPSTFPAMMTAHAKLKSGEAETQPENPSSITAVLKGTISKRGAFQPRSSIVPVVKRIPENAGNVNYSFKFPVISNSNSQEVRVLNPFVSQPVQRGSSFVANFMSEGASEPPLFLVPPPALSITKAPHRRLETQPSKYLLETDRRRRKSMRQSNSMNKVLFRPRV